MTHGVIAGYVFFSLVSPQSLLLLLKLKLKLWLTKLLFFVIIIVLFYRIIFFYYLLSFYFVAQFYHYNNNRRRFFTCYPMLICYFLQKAKREKTRALNPQFMDTALRRSP